MKKFLTVLMVAMLMFVTGCGNNDISELNVDETKKIIEQDLKDMKDEATQQNNCVYKNYSEKYASGNTDIYFMRNTTNPNKSLVTVEVYKNKIRQMYQKGNKTVTNKQEKFLTLWEKQVIQKAA